MKIAKAHLANTNWNMARNVELNADLLDEIAETPSWSYDTYGYPQEKLEFGQWAGETSSGYRVASYPQAIAASHPKTRLETLEKLKNLDIVGDVRGEGFFYGIELVKDKATKESFNDDECERLLRGYLSKALFENGLYCRADDRGDPVIQLAPPLICGQEQFDEMEQILRHVLTEGQKIL